MFAWASNLRQHCLRCWCEIKSIFQSVLLNNRNCLKRPCPARRSELKFRHVLIEHDFLMAKIPTTQEFFRWVMGVNPSHESLRERPVDSVSWYDALIFCNELSKYSNRTRLKKSAWSSLLCNACGVVITSW